MFYLHTKKLKREQLIKEVILSFFIPFIYDVNWYRSPGKQRMDEIARLKIKNQIS